MVDTRLQELLARAEIEVKYKNGKTIAGMGVLTQAQIQQVLDKVSDYYKKIFGIRRLTINICGYDKNGNNFYRIDSENGPEGLPGKGPRAALAGAWTAMCALRAYGDVKCGDGEYANYEV